MNSKVSPARGEIWFVKMPTDPADKGARPAVVVSIDARNRNERSNTVLVVPLSTTPKRLPTHVELPTGETGLEASIAKPEDITLVSKEWLLPSRWPLRRLGELRLRQIAAGVQMAMGYGAIGS